MSLTPPDRRVITFYSYKGGTGRTMTLANVAYRLANTHGLQVIAIDWDLEAPGLHRFFGVSSEVTTKTNGVLDYFIAWREAVRRKDPEPPPEVQDISPWFVRIEHEEHRPHFGSVSLLLAGRLGKGYDARLASLNWQDFYTKEAGAAAVEKLRDQLVSKADVVLIDSRTGLTDVGGICTIQLPDGVVLMASPNRQSIEGAEGVARTIAKASVEDRAERNKARVWFVMSRVSSVDETYLAQKWLADHAPWFDKGTSDGLWLKEDHPGGIQSHVIPHRARWSFDEVVLNDSAKPDPTDPLVMGYEKLAGTLLRWMRGEPPHIPEARRVPSDSQDIDTLQAEVANADKRGDALGLAIALHKLATQLFQVNKLDESIRKTEQAIGIFLSRGARREQALALLLLSMTLRRANRHDEAEDAATQALNLGKSMDNAMVQGFALAQMANIKIFQHSYSDALELLQQEKKILPSPDFRRPQIMGMVQYQLGNKEESLRAFQEALNLAQRQQNTDAERGILENILDGFGKAADFSEGPAIRARLAELNAVPPPSK
jgi:MinD-like ATPase involved in chromosome partitioning or flagellar assembly